MRPIFIIAAVAGFAALATQPDPASAQTRVFVSGQGSDANPCSLAAPCRSFQQAHTAVVAGGEIVALDAAGYGTLNITKALTVSAIGIEASITSNSSSAISINAGTSDAVTLRGLTLFAGTTSGNGIEIASAKSVTIRDCSLSGFVTDGILVEPSANLNVELRNVSVDASGTFGLAILPTLSISGKLTMLVADSSFNGNAQSGILLNGQSSTGAIVATFDVAAANNAGSGMFITSITGKTQPVVMVTGSKLVNNGFDGLGGSGNVQVFVDRTQISGNGSGGSGHGWEATDGAAISSYKNNAVNGNASDALNGVVQITGE